MEKGQVKVFMSYALSDFNKFNINLINEELSSKPRISEVLFTAQNDRKTWITHMGEEIEQCDIFLLFCSQSSLQSKRNAEECQMAYLTDKIIIPIFINSDDIPKLFHVIPSYQFDETREISIVIEEIYEFIAIQAGFSIFEQKASESEDPFGFALKDLMQGNSDIEALALVSREGLIINSILPNEVSPIHIAAMSAIILSTCERVLLEFRKGELGVCVIHGTEGNFTCLDCGEDFILVAVTDGPSSILGDMARTSRRIQRLAYPDKFNELPEIYEHVTFDRERNYTQESGYTLIPFEKNSSTNKTTQNLIAKSIELYNHKKFSGVIEVVDQIIETDPKESYAWYMKASAYINLAKYPRSIFCSNRAIELSPNTTKYLSIKGYALYKMKRFEESIKNYNIAMESNKKDSSIWSYKGLTYRKMRTAKIAFECYEKAIEYDPTNISAYNNEGIAYDEDADYKKAIECYNKALEIEPNYAIAWHNKAETLMKLYKWEDVLYCIDKTLEIQPKNPYTWFLKTDYFYKLGRNEEGRECLLNAMNLITPELLYRIETSDFSLPTII
jgi:tetratricopeptide (TPR) repeat protein